MLPELLREYGKNGIKLARDAVNKIRQSKQKHRDLIMVFVHLFLGHALSSYYQRQ